VAGVYMTMKKWDEALPRLLRVVSIYEESLGPRHIYLADPLTNLGEVYLETGQSEKAIASYERALELRKDGGDGPFKGAETRFGLAKALALAHRDGPRAKALAGEAREAYAKGGKPFEKELAEVDAWLKAN